MHCVTSSRPVFDLTKYKHPRAVHAECLRFIKGIRGPRAGHVTRKQIGDWLSRTPAEAVDAALGELLAEGKIRNAGKRAGSYEIVR
jgi:hypothetical protein